MALDLYTDGDSPSGVWPVADDSNVTKDQTLVRISTVTSGNTDWASSAGTNGDDSEWVVFEIDIWDYLGSYNETMSIRNEGTVPLNLHYFQIIRIRLTPQPQYLSQSPNLGLPPS